LLIESDHKNLRLSVLHIPVLTAFYVGNIGRSLYRIRDVNRASDTVEADAIYLPGSPSNVSVANSHSLYIDGGVGDDVFYVLHNMMAVTVNASANDDRFYVSSYVTSSTLSSHLQNARLNVIGGGASDQLDVNGTPGSDTLGMGNGQITGSGLDIAFSELETINFFLEEEADILVMEDSTGVDPGVGEVTVYAGSGSDDITLGKKTNVGLDQIFINISIHAGDGFDRLFVDDTGSTAAKESIVSATSIIGLLGDPTARIIYSLLEVIDISASKGSNRMTIVSTPADSKAYVNFLDSPDEAIVHGTGDRSSLTILGRGGNDIFLFYQLGNETLATVYGDNGDDSLYVDGTGNRTEPPVNHFTGSQIRWSGGNNDDTMHANLSTSGTSLFDIFDDLNGINKLIIECSNKDTTLLSRETFVANVHDMYNEYSTIERINVLSTARLDTITISLGEGNNSMYFDDTMAAIDVFGGSSSDGT